MELNAGTKRKDITGADQYSDSMAEAMEKAFMREWPVIMGSDPPLPGNDHMRLLFIAVAQGMLRYLVDNPDAITVSIGPGGGTASININTSGTLYPVL